LKIDEWNQTYGTHQPLLDMFVKVHNDIYPYVMKGTHIAQKRSDHLLINRGNNWWAHRIDNNGKRVDYEKPYNVNRWKDPNSG